MIPKRMPSPFAHIQAGFTMLETVLAVALLAILFMIIAPVSIRLLQQNDLDVARNYTVEALRSAQLHSRGGVQDSQWGVKVQTGSVTLFRGASYATRDPDFDTSFLIAPTIMFSGLTEVVYSKLLGLPLTTGSILITNSANDSTTITVNAAGVITY